MSCARRRYRSSALTALSRTSLSLDASAWPNLGVGPERAASSGRGRDEVGEVVAGAFFLPMCLARACVGSGNKSGHFLLKARRRVHHHGAFAPRLGFLLLASTYSKGKYTIHSRALASFYSRS